MISKPIDNIIKSQFQNLYTTGIKNAQEGFEKMNNQLKTLDLFQKCRILIEEQSRIEKLIEGSDYPYYIKYHSNENWLLSQFASRAFLLGLNESAQFTEAVYLGQYQHLINDSLFELKKSVPKYTFEKFIKGTVDPYFFSFEEFYNISEEDYYKIREWQSDHLIKVVNNDYLFWVTQMQLHCQKIVEPLNFVQQQKEIIESLDRVNADVPSIKNALSQLYYFENFISQLSNDDLLLNSFKSYKSKKLDWSAIHPKNLYRPLQSIQKRETHIIGNEVTIFHTINKIAAWLDKVLTGHGLQEPETETNWEKSISSTQQKATKEAEHLIQKIEDIVYDDVISSEEVKEYLIAQLELYRRKFNDFEEKYFFHLLRDEKKFLLNRMIITNAFFSNDPEKELSAFKEALIIYEFSWAIVQIYFDIFQTHKIHFPNSNVAHTEIMALLNQMVLDKDIYEGIENCMDDFMEHFHSYFLPVEIHFQNTQETMHRLFHLGLDRLQNILDDAEPSNKVLYLLSRIKQIRQRELQLKQYENEEYFSKRDHKYSELFKDFLQIEADFITAAKDVDTPKLALPVTTAGAQGLNSFDELPNEKKDFILQMLEDLSITQNNESLLSERKKGSIRGIVEALRNENILPQLSIEKLCLIIAEKIGLQLKSKLDFSETSENYRKKTENYIRNNYHK